MALFWCGIGSTAEAFLASVRRKSRLWCITNNTSPQDLRLSPAHFQAGFSLFIDEKVCDVPVPPASHCCLCGMIVCELIRCLRASPSHSFFIQGLADQQFLYSFLNDKLSDPLVQ